MSTTPIQFTLPISAALSPASQGAGAPQELMQIKLIEMLRHTLQQILHAISSNTHSQANGGGGAPSAQHASSQEQHHKTKEPQAPKGAPTSITNFLKYKA